MNLFQKNRLIFWVLIILVVINVSALASFFLLSKPQPPAPCCPPEEQQCIAFRDELDLSATQIQEVNILNKNYRESAEPIVTAIKETRAAILTELEKPAPDTLIVNTLTNQLAMLQVKIQKENIRQYSELRRVCTPDQAQRLSALFRDLYGCPMKDGPVKHRNRHGQGARQNDKCE
jgi:Spy/CpxP family protein refolding chaperone